MPEISCPDFREFLPSAKAALAQLEEASGKPVQIVEDPQLITLVRIHRARAGEASHLLWIKGSAEHPRPAAPAQWQCAGRNQAGYFWQKRDDHSPTSKTPDLFSSE